MDQARELLDFAREAFSAGRAADALTSAEAAYTILSKAHGPDHPSTLNACFALCAILEALGRYGDAETYARRAVAGTESSSDSRLRVNALARLASIERIQARLDAAEGLYQQAIALAGPGHPDLVALLTGLGVVYKYARRFDEAESLYRQALDILGPDSPRAATLWHNLGGLDHSRRRYASGEQHARRSVELRLRTLPLAHPTVAADQAALASLLVGQGKLDEAEALYRTALAVFEGTYGPDHYEVAVTLNDLGALMAARDENGEAERLFTRSLAIKRGLFAEDHPEIALTARNLENVPTRLGP